MNEKCYINSAKRRTALAAATAFADVALNATANSTVFAEKGRAYCGLQLLSCGFEKSVHVTFFLIRQEGVYS